MPRDPRLNSDSNPDYCYLSEDPDEFPWSLPLPRFWREVIRRTEENLNEERKQKGLPKLSSSYIQQKLFQQTQRVGAAQRRVDPRLERSLFVQAPKQTAASSSSHNQSVPNLKTSIFDVDDANGALSDSSSSLSFSSDSENVTTNKRKHQSDNDLSDDDGDLSFSAFTNRRQTRAQTSSSNKKATSNGTSKTISNRYSLMTK